MSLDWRGDEVERRLRQHLSQNMARATVYLAEQVKRKINRGNPRGTSPSRPGEPPKKVSGRLFQSIATAQMDTATSVVGYVGTNVEYARRLEDGFVGTDAAGRTVDFAPRPFLKTTLAEERAAIQRILARAIE